MQLLPSRLIAVDWSGAASVAEQRRRIVAADWNQGTITLTAGRTRAEITSWLIKQAEQTPAMVVGLDFSFSFPAWFIEKCGSSSIESFWKIAEANADRWLQRCEPPFWGRPGKTCPPDHRAPLWRGYRHCERPEEIAGSPKSTFQIGGAGAVGTGSLRGVATLTALHKAGFSIWPFHPPHWPCVLEIYPRSFTGPVTKSSLEARTAFLKQYLGSVASTPVLKTARASEDAFDALCSVAGMARQIKDFGSLRQAADPVSLLEGAIFAGRSIQT